MTYDTDYVPMGITVTERDRKALRVAKRKERDRFREGYRWVRLNSIHKLFVECDENGEPTENGRKRIADYKRYLGIID